MASTAQAHAELEGLVAASRKRPPGRCAARETQLHESEKLSLVAVLPVPLGEATGLAEESRCKRFHDARPLAQRLCAKAQTLSLLRETPGKRCDDVEPLAATPGKRSDDVEPLAATPGKRSDDVEPLPATPGKRSDDVEPLPATPGKRPDDVEPLPATPGKRSDDVEPLPATPGKRPDDVEPLPATPGKRSDDVEPLPATPGKRSDDVEPLPATPGLFGGSLDEERDYLAPVGGTVLRKRAEPKENRGLAESAFQSPCGACPG